MRAHCYLGVVIIALVICSALSGCSSASPPKSVELSLTGERWLKRLQAEFVNYNPVAAKELLGLIQGRYEQKHITKDDHRVLSRACEAAIDSDWETAFDIVGLPPPKPVDSKASGKKASWEAGEKISIRDLTLPLPKGAKVLEHKAGKPPIDDDVWIVQVPEAKTIGGFYKHHMPSEGWKPYKFDKDSWTKPRAGKSENEIVSIKSVSDDTYEIRVAP